MPGELFDQIGECRRKLVPWFGAGAARRHQAVRIEPEAQVDGSRRDAMLAHQGRNRSRGIPGLRSEIELDRNTGVPMHVLEPARDRRFRRRDAKPVRADRTGKNHAQPGRAILEILARLLVGGGWIGVIDALQDLPGRSRRVTSMR